MTGVNPARFPHSEIPGSKLVCSSPGLIAAYHVLHRLLTPRHPPYALSNLTLLIRLVTDYQRFELYYSIQLSKNESRKGLKKLYKKRLCFPFNLVEVSGFEPLAFWLQTRCSPN